MTRRKVWANGNEEGVVGMRYGKEEGLGENEELEGGRCGWNEYGKEEGVGGDELWEGR